MYCMYTLLSLILLVSEMLKIPRAKVEAHFLKKLDLVTNKCLAQEKPFFENVQGQQKAFQNTQLYANSYVHKFSYYLVYSTKLS